MIALKDIPKLSAAQFICLSGLPRDGSWVKRGSMGHTTRMALLKRGLVKRRRAGAGFEWASNIEPN